MKCSWKCHGSRGGGVGHLVRHHLRQYRKDRGRHFFIPPEEEQVSLLWDESDKLDPIYRRDFCINFKAVVINLERRKDRLLSCTDAFDKEMPSLNLERFPAIDGTNVLVEIPVTHVTRSWDSTNNERFKKIRDRRKGWNSYRKPKQFLLQLSPGERGCAMSHVQAWQWHAGNDWLRPLLVLEDDAKPQPGLLTELVGLWNEVPRDAHILYLGYSRANKFTNYIGPKLAKCDYVWTTVAYIVMPGKVKDLLKLLPINEPIDNWLSHHSHEGRLNNYCVTPKLVYPAKPWEEDSNIVHSDDANPVRGSEQNWNIAGVTSFWA